MTLPIEPNGVAGALVALTTAVGGALYLRRRISRDGVEIAKDRAERAEVESLTSEVQRLRRQAMEDAQDLARCGAENEHLKRDVGRLTGDIRRMVRGLPSATRRVLATDFVGLDDAKGEEG